MTWLLWRQYRLQGAVTAVLLAALAVALLISGVHLADVYHQALVRCGPDADCGQPGLFQDHGVLLDLVNLTLAVPLLVGLFWGVPTIAREAETGTQALAWTQTVSRRRWVAGKVLALVVGTAIAAAALSALVTWWSGPFNSYLGDRFTTGKFDIQGVVPVAYAECALGLGLAAGALIRRTLPALAVTVGVFVTLRLTIESYVRPHYMTARTLSGFKSSTVGVLRGAWQLGSTVTFRGHPVSGPIPMPATCVKAATRAASDDCLAGAGVRMVVRYQPAGRYWAFQGIESGIFLGLAAVLVTVAVVAVLRRDA